MIRLVDALGLLAGGHSHPGNKENDRHLYQELLDLAIRRIHERTGLAYKTVRAAAPRLWIRHRSKDDPDLNRLYPVFGELDQSGFTASLLQDLGRLGFQVKDYNGPPALASGEIIASLGNEQLNNRRENTSSDNPSIALLRVYTNGISDDRIKKAGEVLIDDKLTTNERLKKIYELIPIPPTASAQQLGELLGVTKQAVLKTDWWIQNRKGERENEVGRRRAGHQKRAKEYEKRDARDDY